MAKIIQPQLRRGLGGGGGAMTGGGAKEGGGGGDGGTASCEKGVVSMAAKLIQNRRRGKVDSRWNA